jgi:hypothetical protein
MEEVKLLGNTSDSLEVTVYVQISYSQNNTEYSVTDISTSTLSEIYVHKNLSRDIQYGLEEE